jgi:hypothetical protein
VTATILPVPEDDPTVMVDSVGLDENTTWPPDSVDL